MRANIAIRICWVAGFLLLLVPVLLRCWLLAVTPAGHLREIVDFIYDDGYYYLTVAANLAATGHSTFDGLTATNGYQPLWLLLLAALAKLVGTGTHAYFVATCALIYLLAASTPTLALIWPRGPTRAHMLCLAAGLALVMSEADLLHPVREGGLLLVRQQESVTCVNPVGPAGAVVLGNADQPVLLEAGIRQHRLVFWIEDRLTR